MATKRNYPSIEFQNDFFSDGVVDELVRLGGGLPKKKTKIFLYHKDVGGKTKEICKTSSRRDALKHRLDTMVMIAQHHQYFSNKPSYSTLEKRMKNVVSYSRQLLAELCDDDTLMNLGSMASVRGEELGGYETIFYDLIPTSFKMTIDGTVHEHWDYRGKEFILRTKNAIEELAIVASRVAEQKRIAIQNSKKESRNKGDEVFQGIVKCLCETWEKVFDRKVGASKNPHTQEVDSPLIRFISAAVAPLGINKSNSEIEQYIRRYGKSSKSLASQRAAIDVSKPIVKSSATN